MSVKGVSSAATMTQQELLVQFRVPAGEYGPIDCWWWEGDRLSKDRMRWQLDEMARQGVAGTWFYPRFIRGEPLGSSPPYWSDEWWEFVRFSLEEHRRLGLRAWVSDWTAHEFFQNRLREERSSNPALMGHRLVFRKEEATGEGTIRVEIPVEESVLDTAAYRKVGNGLDYGSRVDLTESVVDHTVVWDAPGPDWQVTVVTRQPHGLDYLNKAVAERWLDLFLGAYKDKVGEFVGRELAAFGPDEMFVLRGNILFSPTLVDRLKQEKEYDLLPWLPGLFTDIGPQTEKVRCDYYGTMVSLLDDNFYSVFAEQLHDLGMIYSTIATWGRGDILDQTYQYGDFFKMMRCFDVTGNEDPGAEGPGKRCFIDAKLSSSVAHVYGKRRAAVCGYWASGWGATQDQNVAWTNENYAYGINLYNRHGGLYSTVGGWYEWVPPAVHFRQPYWRYWKQFTDYVKRLSFVLSQGRPCADVALLYPLTTVHAHWSGDRDFGEAAKQTGEATFALAKRIYKSGIDFDFIDEPSLEHARTSNGILSVGDLEFQALVLPPMTTAPRPVFERIQTFYAEGGTVVACGRLPSASPEFGRSDPELGQLVASVFGVTADNEVLDVVSQTNDLGGQAFFVPGEIVHVPFLLSQAITRDLVTPVKDLFHTHRRVGETDVYFLFNACDERRRVSVSFQTEGDPEIWDAWTGSSRPVHGFAREDGRTRVRLTMEPYEGQIVVFGGQVERPAVVEDTLSSITNASPRDGQIEVQGLSAAGGTQHVRVEWQARDYEAVADVEAPPEPIPLNRPWQFQLEPVLDNRWGDFRYPATDEVLGAEARSFQYMDEGDTPGTQLNWQDPDYDDSAWETVKYTYGPYWWRLGPFQKDQEPPELLRHVESGVLRSDRTHPVPGKVLAWQRYTFSTQFGFDDAAAHHDWGGMCGVPDEFIVLGETSDERDAVSYFFTHVCAPRAAEWNLDFGGDAPFERQAWVNGAQVLAVSGPGNDSVAKVHLNEGANTVFLRVAQPEGKRLETYAVFVDPAKAQAERDPRVPLLRWFQEPEDLVFDILPTDAGRVGWYRFVAPPGVRSIQLNVRARAVQAWVDGSAVEVQDGTITLGTPGGPGAQVTLRVEHEKGCYAGAASTDPVKFDCVEGTIALGDWSEHGLASYSGGAVYTQTASLDANHLTGQVLLDLGDVRTVAEVDVNGKSAGTLMARPFSVDITALVKEGENEIQVRVVNTLANHMSSYPTRFVYEGHTVSGLLGPVKIRFLTRTTLIATETSACLHSAARR
jgi:glycosyl hydrolase family 106( putative alpha-L-rhamnosidase)/glycosyl hydrolase family 2